MTQLLAMLSNMPTSTKGVLGVVAGGGLGFGAFKLFGGNGLIIFMLGVAVVALILQGYRWMIERSKKRQAARFGLEMAQAGAATPQSISRAEQLAKVDDIRRKFEEGMSKFSAAGKDAYSLPWYMVAGEPGSGKTEAIRHSNIGFPPGLQDELQGIGGTLNMNWWFTNQAVLLDLAGRLIFEDVEAGASSEWKEFLKLLNAHRPNCPINGILLVIPADSLIKDSADDIHRKGSKIARQLEMIQHTLDIRFPVFVVITKCDLINGFREFFEDMDKPEQQHQILGWSNPLSIDEPFKADALDQYLAGLLDRIRAWRLSILENPTPAKDLSDRRADEVDTLYNFPHSFSKIVSPIKRYLEIVFAGGQWAAKPLFLRGIYFTSSMREGVALDADLAERLGVPLESLPEGRVWERDHAFFLRDLFVKKIFAEWGLVTRASNVRKEDTRRRMTLLGAGFAGVLFLMLTSWFGARSLENSVGLERDLWTAAAGAVSFDMGKARNAAPLVVSDPANRGLPPYTYGGQAKIKVGDDKITVSQFHNRLQKLVRQPLHIPFIFQLSRPFNTSLNRERRDAHRFFCEVSLVEPIVHAAREKMRQESGARWTPAATVALGELIRIEIEASAAELEYDRKDIPENRLHWKGLMRYILADAEFSAYEAESAGIEEALAVAHGESLGNRKKWPPAWLALGDRLAENEPLDKGVAAFVARCSAPADLVSLESQLARIKELWPALEELARQSEKPYSEAEKKFLVFFKGNMNRLDFLKGFEEIEKDWDQEYAALARAMKSLQGGFGPIESGFAKITICQSGEVDLAYAKTITNIVIQAGNDFKALALPHPKEGLLDKALGAARKNDKGKDKLKALPAGGDGKEKDAEGPVGLAGDIQARMDAARQRLMEKVLQGNVVQQVKQFRAEYMGVAGRVAQYRNRFPGYQPVLIPDKARNRKLPWAQYQKRFAGLEVSAVNETLEGVCKQIDSLFASLEKSGVDLPAERIKVIRGKAAGGLTRIESRNFKRQCSEAMENWSRLAGNSLNDRESLMAMAQKIFSDGYMLSVPENEADYVAQFWQDVIGTALECHADDTILEIQKLMPELKQYARFPLDIPRPGGTDLSEDEMARAVKAFDKVRPLNPTEKGKTLGEGAVTGDARVDRELQRLRDLQLGDKMAWIMGVKNLLKGIPVEKGFRLLCTVSLLPNTDQQRLLQAHGKGDIRDDGACPVWTIVEARLKKAVEAKKFKVIQAEPTAIARLPYPGDGFEFAFFKYPSDPAADRSFTFDKAWDALRMLHQFQAEKAKAAPTKWDVPVMLRDDTGRERWLWMQLEFEQELPAVKDWPTYR